MINPRKLERVSRAICAAAGRYESPGQGHIVQPYSEQDPPPPERVPCRHCYNEVTRKGECYMWYTFKSEAEAAINAMKGF